MREVIASAVLASVVGMVGLALWFTGYGSEAAFGLGFIPARLMGAPLPPDIASVPVWFTPFSALLIHYHPLSLFFNVAILFAVGTAVERVVGSWSMTLLYLVSILVAASFQFVLAGPASALPLVGAGGVASAALGAYAMLHTPHDRTQPNPWLHALWLLAAWTAINLGMALVAALDWAANIGGFVAGIALARPLLRWRWRNA